MRVNHLDSKQIVGFSVSGRAGAGVFLDSRGDVIVEPWSDSRHRNLLAELQFKYPAAPTYGITLIAKYLWLQQHQPNLCHKIRHCLYAKDFLLYKLTGNCVTDPSSGPDDLKWFSQDLMEVELLPTPALPWEIAGELDAAAAAALGCAPGIPVAVGAHDGICANTGCAMIDESEFALTLGTHAVCRTVTGNNLGSTERFYCYPPDKHTYGGNSWHIGSTLNWMLTTIAGLPSELSDAELGAFNKSILHTSHHDNPLFLPYLGGQTIPEQRETASGSFHGISLHTDPQQMIAAVFEGCAFAIHRTYQTVTELTGAAETITLTGGGIVFEPWLQLIADVFQKELVLSDGGVEGRGAAIFASVALGEFNDVSEAAIALQPQSVTIQPGPMTGQLTDRLATFRHLSRHLSSQN